MQQLRNALTLALAKTMADNLVISEQAREEVSQDAVLCLCRRICFTALDPSVSDEQALAQIRALSRDIVIGLRDCGL